MEGDLPFPRSRDAESGVFIRLERLLFISFLLVLFWAPLPFGSVRSWAIALLFVFLASILGAVLLLSLNNTTVVLSERACKRCKWPAAVLGMLVLWVFCQTLPLPPSLLALISPRAAELHTVAGWVPITLDLARSQTYLLVSASCLMVFMLVALLVNSAKRVQWFMWTLVLSGVFQASYGALMVLSGLELGFLVEKYVGHGSATGTFVNRNHLAGYLVICLSAGTGLLLSQLSRESPDSWRKFMRQSIRLLLSPKIVLRLLLAFMVIGLVLTRSRMGNSAFFVSLAVAGVVGLLMGRKFSPKLVLLLASLFIVDAVIVGQWFGIDKVVERLETVAPDAERRLDVSVDSKSILDDFPLTGSGGGSYYSVFTYYQPVAYDEFYRHAHNDYVEFASDLGYPGIALLGLFVLLVLRRAILLQRTRNSRLQRGIGFAMIMAITWLLMHSAVDFNLQIPANSVSLTALFALAFIKIGHHP